MLLSEFLARVLQCTADEKKLLNIELQANNGDDGDVDANGDFIVNHLNAMRLSGDDEPNTLICLAADDKSSSEDEEDDAVVGLDMTSSKGYGHDLPFHLPSWLAMDVDIESDAGGGGDGWYYEDEEGDDADTLQAETDAEHLPSMLLDLYMDDNSKNTNANSAASVDISSNNNNNNSSGGGGSSLAPLLDGEWLLVQCQQQVILFSDDHGLTGEQLSQKILSILTSTSNGTKRNTSYSRKHTRKHHSSIS